MLKRYSKEARAAARSKQVVERALASGTPFTYLRNHMDDWYSITYPDFMWLVRSRDNVYLTSEELVAVYERHGTLDNAAIAQILRDRLALREADINVPIGEDS